MAAYLPVQLPIALGEMVVTGIAVRSIGRQRPEVLEALRVVSRATLAMVLVLGMTVSILSLSSEARASNTARRQRELHRGANLELIPGWTRR